MKSDSCCPNCKEVLPWSSKEEAVVSSSKFVEYYSDFK